MRKTTTLLFLLTILIFPSGCIVQSIHPFLTKDAEISFPEIDGEWVDSETKSKDIPVKPWIFKGKLLQTFDEDGVEGPLEISYFKIGESIFMDITLTDQSDEPINRNEWWQANVLSVHTLCKVKLDGDSLVLIPLDYNWLKDAISNNKVTLPYINQNLDIDILFTATPADWMAFLNEHKDNDQIYAPDFEFKLERLK